MEPQHIALFLKQHPRFFEQHPDVLEHLHLADHTSNSLVERQAILLQQKKNELEKQLHQFLQNGEANDRISEQLHRLTLELIPCKNLNELLNDIPTLIQEHFAAAQVLIRVWGNSELSLPAHFSPEMILSSPPAGWDHFPRASVLPAQAASFEPVCHHELPPNIREWFAKDLQSFALLPLVHSAGAWGMLGLGSYDIRRFQPTHGTLYLRRLADIVSAVLIRHIQSL